MAAVTNLKTISESRKDMFLIPISKLKIEEGFNVREDYGDIDELAKSLAENGQLQPLTVRLSEGSAYVTDGHRRMRAYDIAKDKYKVDFKGFWCVPENPGANEESRILDLFTRNSGKPLTPIEQASAVTRLINMNWKVAEISKKIGKSKVYVNNILNLSSASKEVREVVREGLLSPTAAIKLSQAPKAKQDAVLLKINTLCDDPTGEKKVDEKAKPKKKMSVAQIEKEVSGESTMISAKSIKDIIKKVDGLINKSEDTEWKAVRYGLELALGKKELDPKMFA